MSATNNINAEKIQGNLNITSISATTISGTTYFGDGSNLTGIPDTFVVGGTYVDSTNTIALLRNDGNFVNVTGVTNTYVTGGTVSVPATDNSNSGSIGLFYKDSDGTPRTLPFEDTYTSGTTFTSNQATLTRNDGTEIFKLSGGTNVTLSNPSTNQIKIDVTSISVTSIREVTGTTTFATANETVNCTSGTFIVNLPTAVGIQGTTYTLVNSGTGIITLDPSGSETINGSLTIDLKRQYISRTVQSNGSNWIVI